MRNYINLTLSGLEEPLTEMEQFVQDTATALPRTSCARQVRPLTRRRPRRLLRSNPSCGKCLRKLQGSD